MRALMSITKALADEHRVRALMALQKGELCVCQITELFRLAPSTISKHLSILSQAGLVESRKKGRWIYYRLPNAHAPRAVRQAIQWIQTSLQRNPRVAEDRRHLKRILLQDPTLLCKRQSQK